MILEKLIECALQCDQKELPISGIDIYILHLTWLMLLKVGSVEIGIKSLEQNEIKSLEPKCFLTTCHQYHRVMPID